MDKVVGGFAAAFGRGLAEGLGAVIVLVVLIGLAIFFSGDAFRIDSRLWLYGFTVVDGRAPF